MKEVPHQYVMGSKDGRPDGSPALKLAQHLQQQNCRCLYEIRKQTSLDDPHRR